MSHVLVCDDETHIVRPLQITLQRAGHRVSVAFDGEEAWEVLRGDEVDLLITDFEMPRLNGLELCGRVRETPSLQDLPIMLLSGKKFELAEDEIIAKWRIQAFIDKPFSPKAVVQYVEESLVHAHH